MTALLGEWAYGQTSEGLQKACSIFTCAVCAFVCSVCSVYVCASSSFWPHQLWRRFDLTQWTCEGYRCTLFFLVISAYSMHLAQIMYAREFNTPDNVLAASTRSMGMGMGAGMCIFIVVAVAATAVHLLRYCFSAIAYNVLLLLCRFQCTIGV